MKTTLTLIILVFIFLPGQHSLGQTTPEQLVPYPTFATYQPKMSRLALELSLQMEDKESMHGIITEGGRQIRYESVDMDVRIYTSSRSIHEVRELYFDLMLQGMKPEGMPPDALDQLDDFLENEVFYEIEDEPMLDFDLDLVESYYREAGLTAILDWISCYRELVPDIENKTTESFRIEMNELQLRRTDTIRDGMNFYIIEVGVEQPYVNVADCRLVDETIIIYNIYRMVALIE
jgi:hypothetical protein